MSIKIRRIKITIETQISYSICRPAGHFCRRCGCRAALMTPPEAAELFSTTLETIERALKAGHIHLLETGDESSALICAGSLRH